MYVAHVKTVLCAVLLRKPNLFNGLVKISLLTLITLYKPNHT